MPNQYRAWAEFDRAALINNANRARLNSNASIMAVVKANAYGHGIKFVATALAPHVDAFAIATVEEGIELRALFPDKAITCLSGFHQAAHIKPLKSHRITPVIFNQTQIRWLETGMRLARPVWVKVDTGMGRLGFAPDQVQEAIWRLQKIDCEVSLISHFASADTPDVAQNETQQANFQATMGEVKQRSFANSAALLSRPQDHYDVIRPGIMLYGSSPFADQAAVSLGLQPVMHLYAKLLDVKRLQKGQTVGYGATWQAKDEAYIGIVSIGYADGYPRCVSDQAQVVIEGRRYPIVGRVSMDSMAVLLGQEKAIPIETKVELWGEHISIDEVAAWANTISYELMCKITPRVERITR